MGAAGEETEEFTVTVTRLPGREDAVTGAALPVEGVVAGPVDEPHPAVSPLLIHVVVRGAVLVVAAIPPSLVVPPSPSPLLIAEAPSGLARVGEPPLSRRGLSVVALEGGAVGIPSSAVRRCVVGV